MSCHVKLVPATADCEVAEKQAAGANSDRRSHRRFGVQRPGKIFRRSAQQYAPATSRDLSFGGALLEVESERSFTVGEVLDVGIALTPKAVVPSAALVRGIVVRSH